jgi:hypothetical protein
MEENEPPRLPLAAGASSYNKPANAAGFKVLASINSLSHDQKSSWLWTRLRSKRWMIILR